MKIKVLLCTLGCLLPAGACSAQVERLVLFQASTQESPGLLVLEDGRLTARPLCTPSGPGDRVSVHFGARVAAMECGKWGRIAVAHLGGREIQSRVIEFNRNASAGTFSLTGFANLPDRGLAIEVVHSGARLGQISFTAGLWVLGALASLGDARGVFQSRPDDRRFKTYHGMLGGDQMSMDWNVTTVGEDRVLQVSEPWDGKQDLKAPRPQLSLGIAVPDATLSRIGEKRKGMLLVSNDEGIAVVLDGDRRKPSKAKELGTSLISTYDRRDKRWRSFEMPGSEPRVRGFVDWVAAIACEEEEGEPRNEGIPPELPAARRNWLESIHYFPGLVVLWNIHTGQRFEVRTGVADTEVVGVEDRWVFYRVNDELFQAELSAMSLGKGTRIAKGPEILDVHWVLSARP